MINELTTDYSSPLRKNKTNYL